MPGGATRCRMTDAQNSLSGTHLPAYALRMTRLPRRFSLFAGFCLIALGSARPRLAAQSVISVPPQQCVWRAGDDPAWAAPNLDENGWLPYAQWQVPPEQPHIWVRCHADLGALRGLAHPAIQIGLDGAYQIFVNGASVGGAGNVRTGNFSANVIRQYSLPAAALDAQSPAIALRVVYRFSPLSFSRPLEIYAGDSEGLKARRAAIILAQSAAPLANAIGYALIGVVGLMLLGLFYYDRSRPELLYLSITCGSVAILRTGEFCSAAFMNYSSVLFGAMHEAGDIAATIATLLFFFALARRRVHRLYWLAVAIVVAEDMAMGITLLLPVDQAYWLVKLTYTAFSWTLLRPIAQVAISLAPFVAFWPYRQITGRMRPLAALCMLWGASVMVWFAVSITADSRWGLPNVFSAWRPELLGMRAFVTACVLVALLALLFRDQRLVTEERALLAGEMHAASEIQRMLAPAKIDTAPGLQIEVAFHPMRDVGGDFYLCRVLPSGRQRVLVGDVSGKGAAAAMAATLLLGAAERREGNSPSELLRHLNLVMRDSRVPGFATCLCGDIEQDGTVVLANAGHLAPYHQGAEVAVPSSLPLGLNQDAADGFKEIAIRLSPGDTLVFLSDGVVEARSKTGELFGFSRTAAISTQSARDVAQAAQEFGQEDDITVLALRWMALGEQSATQQTAQPIAPS